jgi:hypothetical protein
MPFPASRLPGTTSTRRVLHIMALVGLVVLAGQPAN